MGGEVLIGCMTPWTRIAFWKVTLFHCSLACPLPILTLPQLVQREGTQGEGGGGKEVKCVDYALDWCFAYPSHP